MMGPESSIGPPPFRVVAVRLALMVVWIVVGILAVGLALLLAGEVRIGGD